MEVRRNHMNLHTETLNIEINTPLKNCLKVVLILYRYIIMEVRIYKNETSNLDINTINE